MTTFTELLPHAGGFLLSEGGGHISRDTIALKAGHKVRPGEILGQITEAGPDQGKYTPWTPSEDDGTENAAGIAYGAIDASAGDATGTAIVRLAEVSGHHLVLPISGTLSAARGNFAELLIVIRD